MQRLPLVGLLALSSLAHAEMRAGAARRVITPDLATPVYMAGLRP